MYMYMYIHVYMYLVVPNDFVCYIVHEHVYTLLYIRKSYVTSTEWFIHVHVHVRK